MGFITVQNHVKFLVKLLCVLAVVPVSSSAAVDTDLVSGEALGKTLVSYPTLVSILKARNSTRPLLSPSTAQLASNLQLTGLHSQLSPLVSIQIQPLSQSVPSPSQPAPYKHICSPVTLEKSTSQIAKLCAGHRKGDKEEIAGPFSKCMERYCVTIIPEADDDNNVNTGFGNEIAAYTECSAVDSLFKILVKSSSIVPKCYDCSR